MPDADSNTSRAERGRTPQAKWAKKKRLADPEWAEKERARDRERRTRQQERMVAYNRAWREKNREHVRERRQARREVIAETSRRRKLARHFGMTMEAYDALLLEQNGVCAICRRAETAIEPRTGQLRRLAVDHNHTTGAVRGLLCGNCNHGLGKFKEDCEVLMSAIQYLRLAAANTPPAPPAP